MQQKELIVINCHSKGFLALNNLKISTSNQNQYQVLQALEDKSYGQIFECENDLILKYSENYLEIANEIKAIKRINSSGKVMVPKMVEYGMLVM